MFVIGIVGLPPVPVLVKLEPDYFFFFLFVQNLACLSVTRERKRFSGAKTLYNGVGSGTSHLATYLLVQWLLDDGRGNSIKKLFLRGYKVGRSKYTCIQYLHTICICRCAVCFQAKSAAVECRV